MVAEQQIMSMNDRRLPEGLYDFQREDASSIHSFLQQFGGAADFSEMGTGKTAKFIAAMESLVPVPHLVLVICPKIVRSVWKTEVEKWTGRKAYTLGDYQYSRFTELNKMMVDAALGKIVAPAYVVVHYEALRVESIYETLKAIPFTVLCLDEAHKIRNTETKMYRAVRDLNIPLRVFMTGTPVVNSVEDVYPYLNFVMPKRSGWESLAAFRRNFVVGYESRYGFKVVRGKNNRFLNDELRRFSVKRTKDELGRSLPPFMYQTVPVEMVDKQRQIYDTMESQLFAEIDNGEILEAVTMLSRIHRLRQIASEPALIGASADSIKRQTAVELVDMLNDKVVIFGIFKGSLRAIEDDLKQRGVKCVTITGDDSMPARQRAVVDFQTGDAQVCLATTHAASEGIALHAAATVIMLDRWWSPAVNSQATARVHRGGQMRSVTVYSLVAENSIDHHIEEVLSHKGEQATELTALREALDMRRAERSIQSRLL